MIVAGENDSRLPQLREGAGRYGYELITCPVVAQDGRTVADAVFDEVLAGPPPEGRPHTTRLVWYAATSAVPLQAGAATLRLVKEGRERVRADARRVDCVLLTADPVYAADERDFVPQTYVRFTPRAAKAPESPAEQAISSPKCQSRRLPSASSHIELGPGRMRIAWSGQIGSQLWMPSV